MYESWQFRSKAGVGTDDLELFSSGFYAYQQEHYNTSISYMDILLQRYPTTVLRDMALFWLSQAYFKAGYRQEAARSLVQFFREFPAMNYIKQEIDEELIELARQYEVE